MEGTYNMIFSKDKTYKDLIDYASIRKQLSRIIPVYYTDYQNHAYSFKRTHFTNIEEYEKLKQEIISLKESISILQSKKQQKLQEIKDLRCLMGKIGTKKRINDGGNEDGEKLPIPPINNNSPVFLEKDNDYDEDNDNNNSL